MKVTAPDGSTWMVRRRWLAWSPRWPNRPRRIKRSGEKREKGDRWSWLDLPIDELSLVIVLVLAVFLILIIFVLPALIFVLQVLVFLVLAGLAVAGRVLLRRPWKIEAVRAGDPPQKLEWEVVGFWRSRRVLREIAQGLSMGHRFIEPEGSRLIEGG
jgi:hypothetical protein